MKETFNLGAEKVVPINFAKEIRKNREGGQTGKIEKRENIEAEFNELLKQAENAVLDMGMDFLNLDINKDKRQSILYLSNFFTNKLNGSELYVKLDKIYNQALEDQNSDLYNTAHELYVSALGVDHFLIKAPELFKHRAVTEQYQVLKKLYDAIMALSSARRYFSQNLTS